MVSTFSKFGVDFIQKEEIRSILLNLNIDLSQLVLEDYFEAQSTDLDSTSSFDSYHFEMFKSLYLLILRNQSSFFREIYNGKKPCEINLQKHLKENNENIKLCFETYDVDKSGYLCHDELLILLQEMNLHKQFERHYNPAWAFNNFVDSVWRSFDVNMDDKISYEEFIEVFNTILDR